MGEVGNSEREQSITSMIHNIERVDQPVDRVNASTVPEYKKGAISKGHVIGVPQAEMRSSFGLPIRTDNLDKCVAGLLRTPLPSGKFRIDLVHMQDGDLSHNAHGHKLEDISKISTNQTKAIFLHSDKSYATGQGTARELAYPGVETKNIINLHGGKSLIDVVYRPENDTIYARVKDADEVQVFEGFNKKL